MYIKESLFSKNGLLGNLIFLDFVYHIIYNFLVFIM